MAVARLEMVAFGFSYRFTKRIRQLAEIPLPFGVMPYVALAIHAFQGGRTPKV